MLCSGVIISHSRQRQESPGEQITVLLGHYEAIFRGGIFFCKTACFSLNRPVAATPFRAYSPRGGITRRHVDMEIVLRNKFSSLGMFLGGIALILSIVQFSFGPFSPKPPALEVIVAEKVSAVKQGVIAGLKGERPAARTEKTTVDIDSIILNAGIILAVVALGLSFIGGMCKESRWGISGALLFSGLTLTFHAVLLAFGLIVAVLLLLFILSLVTGG